MLGARWLVGIACCVAACAAGGPSRVRDIDGKALPPYAVTDAAGPVHTVQCRDGNTYMVVANRSPMFMRPGLVTVLRLRERDMADVCDRILASSL
jgi:hypothetical protein